MGREDNAKACGIVVRKKKIMGGTLGSRGVDRDCGLGRGEAMARTVTWLEVLDDQQAAAAKRAGMVVLL